jgi:NADH-quinone oxidoreductase subunit E
MECTEITKIHIPDNDQYRELGAFIDSMRNVPGPLIQVLHRAQHIFGYLPIEVQHFVSRKMNISQSKIYGVVTFYNFFRTEPIGEHIINICLGTACHVKGAGDVSLALQKELDIKIGSTTADRFFTLSTARCFGACGLAPVIMIDDEVYGRLNPQKAVQVVNAFRLEHDKKSIKDLH